MDKLTTKQLASIYGAIRDWWGVERTDQVFKNVVNETGVEPISAEDSLDELRGILRIVREEIRARVAKSGQETGHQEV